MPEVGPQWREKSVHQPSCSGSKSASDLHSWLAECIMWGHIAEHQKLAGALEPHHKAPQRVTISHPICRPGSRCSLVASKQSTLHAAGLQAAVDADWDRPWLRAAGSGEGQPAGGPMPAGAAAISAPAWFAAASAATAAPCSCTACNSSSPRCCPWPLLLLLPHRLYSRRGCSGRAASGAGGSTAGGAASRDRSHTCE